MDDQRTQIGRTGAEGEEGFLLLGALVLIFLLLLALSVAAPQIARGMQREKEVESERRANQYVRAIRMYYRKFGHYPGSIEQLEKTNNQRFLRQRYVDPLTGKADWRLIHVGENQTKVKGFFGQELQGLQGGLGSAASLASGFGASTQSGGQPPAFGSSGTGPGLAGSGAGVPVSASGAGANGSGGVAAGSGVGAATGTAAASNGLASKSLSELTGTGGPIMGIGSAKSGAAMVVVNEQTTYETWEFLYDPRIEQLYAKASLLGGLSSGPATGSGLGSLGGSQSGGGVGAGNGTVAPGTTGFGTTGFGNSGFGAGSSTGQGSGSGTPVIAPPSPPPPPPTPPL